MPLEKVKIYRISVLLEEKIDYFAHDKKVARHEATRRYQLLSLRHTTPGTAHTALLPITSDATDAISSSPLAGLARAAAQNGMDPDDATSQLLNPSGPWVLEQQLQVPDCSSKVTFTTKHAKTNMTVAHWLKVVFRVERGTDSDERDSKGKKKQVSPKSSHHIDPSQLFADILPSDLCFTQFDIIMYVLAGRSSFA